jgi:hypothetical protein
VRERLSSPDWLVDAPVDQHRPHIAKPTFLAFAIPFYAMETVRAARTRRVGGILFRAVRHRDLSFLDVLPFCRGFEGLIYHL